MEPVGDRMKKLKNVYFLGMIISLVLIFLVFRKVDIKDVFATFLKLNYFYVAIFICGIISNFYLKAYRWRAIFKDANNISLSRFTHFFVVGMMGNSTLPLRMGEMIRGFLVSRKLGINKSSVFATIFAERVFDMTALLFLFLVIIVTGVVSDIPVAVRKTAFVMIIFVLSCFILLIVSSRRKNNIMTIVKKIPFVSSREKLVERIHSFIEGLHVLRHDRHVMKLAFLSILIWLFEGFLYYILAIAFGFKIGIFGGIFVMIAICIGIMLPSAPGSVGVYEASAVAALVIIGVAKHEALAYAMFDHILQLILLSVLVLIFVVKEGISLRELKKIEEEI